MSDGRITRLAVFLSLLMLAPLAGAATPSPTQPAANPTGGQEITDLSVDPTGEFAAGVVAFDAAKNNILGGASGQVHRDIYICDYGAPPATGTGCRGLMHNVGTLDAPTPNAPQRVDTTFIDAGGRQGRYAVAGPDGRISLWSHASDTALWSVEAASNRQALNITVAPDASRVAVGVAPAGTGGGFVEVRHGAADSGRGIAAGGLAFTIELRNAADAPVRPTSLDYARAGDVLAIGTTDGLLLANPTVAPTGSLSGIPQAQSVTKVALSADGQWVAAAATNGVFLAKVQPGVKPSVASNSVFNRGFGETAQDVALSADGSRFAAAAGSKIHFFRQLDTSAVAEPVGSAFDAGARIASLAYDETGSLLVAVAGNEVIGFGPNKNTPLWRFDATQTAFGALDGPLKKVTVSDDAQRIVVAGRTKMMAYNSVVGINASLATTSGATAISPTQTASLTLTLKNTGSLSDNYSFIVTTPVGWPSASAPSLALDPEQVGTVRFNVTAPVGQAPGQYGFQVRVRSEVADELAQRRGQVPSYNTGAAWNPSLNLTIARSVVLNVSIPDDRLLLRQGGEQTVVVTLRNEGNAEGVVNLSTRQELTRGASWDVQFDGGNQVRVPASGTLNVNMIVTAPSDAGSGDRNIITVRAREGENVEATDHVIAYVDAQFGAELRSNRTAWEFYPGQVQTIRVNVTNIGNTEDTYNLTYEITPASVASDWRVTIETDQLTVQRGETKSVLVTVKAVASDAREASLAVRAESQASPETRENQVVLSLTVIPRPPTDDDEDRLLPGPAPLALLGLVGLLALARRARNREGGR